MECNREDRYFPHMQTKKVQGNSGEPMERTGIYNHPDLED